MDSKKVFLLSLLVTVIVLFSLYFSFIKEAENELYFAEWDGVFYTGNEYVVLNIIGISKLSLKDLQKYISKVEISSESLEIDHFDISSSDSSFKGHTIFTIAVNGTMLKDSEEIIDNISILFNDQSEQTYRIGKIKLVSLEPDNTLIPGNTHFVSYNSTSQYMKELKNDSNSQLILKDIQLGNENIHFENISINEQPFDKEFVVEPGETVKVTAKFSLLDNKLLYIISPNYTYEIDNNEYSHYFDSSIVNVLELKKEQLDYMLEK